MASIQRVRGAIGDASRGVPGVTGSPSDSIPTAANRTDHPSPVFTHPCCTRDDQSASHQLEDAVENAMDTMSDVEPARDMSGLENNTQTQAQATIGMQVSPGSQSEHLPNPCQPVAVPEHRVDGAIDAHHSASQVARVSKDPNMETAITTPQVMASSADHSSAITPVKPRDTPLPSAENDNALTAVFFKLYLDEEADPEDPPGCVKLTGLTTRDDLFTEIQGIFEDDLSAGDQIVAVKVRRADGEKFKGPEIRTMPIRRSGQQDMWRELIQTMSEYGVGDGGLRGYVKVKRCTDAK